jgi:hypothetical protein
MTRYVKRVVAKKLFWLTREERVVVGRAKYTAPSAAVLLPFKRQLEREIACTSLLVATSEGWNDSRCALGRCKRPKKVKMLRRNELLP